MKIINQTKNTALAQNASMACTTFERIKGLLGRKDLEKGEGLVIKACNSIHTFFMQFPIDVLFLDRNNKVVRAISKMKPFRISNIYFKAVLVIELPANTIQNTSTSVGDLISLE